MPSRRTNTATVLLISVVLLASTSCTASPSPAKSASAPPAAAFTATATATQATQPYSSTSFVVPFDIALPSWVVPAVKEEQRNFVTWDGAKGTALRVMHPVEVYSPAGGAPFAAPADFVGFLRSQSRFGVRLRDVERLKAGPYPATLLTMTSSESADGSFGCPTKGMAAADCYGAQPEYALRMAVLKVRGTLLLIWLRDEANAKALRADSASLTTMITGLRFPARAVTPEKK
jgi:hypothetical protein